MTDFRAEFYAAYNRMGAVIGQPEVLAPIDEGGPGPAPGPVGPPTPAPVDSDGCAQLAVVEALIAAEGPSIDMGVNLLNGAPNAPAVVPRKFQTTESVARMPDGDAKVIATLSLNASEFHQNRVVRYFKGPWYKGGRWMEGDTVPNALSSNKGAAWLAQAVVGRHRRIKARAAQPHFLWLTEDDHGAGAP